MGLSPELQDCGEVKIAGTTFQSDPGYAVLGRFECLSYQGFYFAPDGPSAH